MAAEHLTRGPDGTRHFRVAFCSSFSRGMRVLMFRWLSRFVTFLDSLGCDMHTHANAQDSL